MKLTRQLYAVVVLGLVLVLAVFAVFAHRREMRLFETEMRHDAHVLGHAMSAMVYEIWRDRGEAQALSLIRDANAGESFIRIRWVWLEGATEDAYRPQVTLERLPRLIRGEETVVRARRVDGTAALFTYVPLKAPAGRPGALELSEPLTALVRYTRSSFLWLLFMTAGLIAVGGVSIGAAGHWMVGKRMQALVGHARRIGEGDLSASPGIPGSDEIAELGSEMGAMAGRLREARDELVEQNNARIEALEQLRHAERLATLGQLSAGLAHEFGTPLNVVGGRAKMMAVEELDAAETVACARIIQDQVKRMTDIMRQFLNFARRRPSARTLSDIRETAGRVVDMLGAAARKRGVTFRVAEAPDLPAVAIDPDQMQQVLTNLVLNGIQAMPRGGSLEVGFEVERVRRPSPLPGEDTECLAVYVEDEGEGIPEESLRRILEPFFTTKGAGEGTGLGLSIANDIVKDHGGWVDVTSNAGEGTRFTVFLPLRTSECTDES